jgi:L-ascorbate metabolism protein UlaG (beta-lactamase superfamily)
MIQSYARKTLSTRDHARTAATAILDALLPTKRRHRRQQQQHPFHASDRQIPPLLRSFHVDNTPAASFQKSLHNVPQLHEALQLHDVSQMSHQFTPADVSFSTSPHAVCLTRLGHSSMLINLFGTIILTDPVLSDRVGIEFLGKTIGIERYTSPLLAFQHIPKPDIILLSHAHFDHTDLPTLRQFASTYSEDITVVCAKNTRDVIDNLPWKAVHELDWDEELWLGEVKVRGVEVIHNGWRCPWERDRASGHTESGRSYNAYIIEKNGVKMVFGGDTAFTERFADMCNEGIDIAMMPIGAYQDYETLHCTPEQALQMSTSMNARYCVPMHFGTFQQSNEDPSEPLLRLLAAASLYSSVPLLTQIGEVFSLI